LDVLSRIKLIRGDICQADADAIVNAANNDLKLGAGVAGAIRRGGGPSIQQECDRIGSIPLGEAAVTGGGDLKARYVIHAASMRLGGTTSEENLRLCTRNSLERAKEKGVRSIAFPAIGTGVAGFPMRRCAEVMLEETAKHLSGDTTVAEVSFVLFDSAALEVFRTALETLGESASQGQTR